ncbi:hypothetical protein MRB53_026741 [Persea americana]|uniref:Uncharacterized protein n=1 Tax=Persea americana TaxID=3435 RepID=A0ACC2LIW9_PERAE|nr:hypothetical protein MRB53_026741 [Persea americana]
MAQTADLLGDASRPATLPNSPVGAIPLLLDGGYGDRYGGTALRLSLHGLAKWKDCDAVRLVLVRCLTVLSASSFFSAELGMRSVILSQGTTHYCCCPVTFRQI